MAANAQALEEDEERSMSPVNVVASTCTTRMDTLQFVHKWSIEQFSVQKELSSVGDSIASARFGDAKHTFILKLFPQGKDEDCTGYISLFLQILNCPDPKLQFRVNFTIETLDGPRGCALNKNAVIINKMGIVTASKFFSLEQLKIRAARYTPNDTLSIGTELTVFGENTLHKEIDPYDVLTEYPTLDSSGPNQFEMALDRRAASPGTSRNAAQSLDESQRDPFACYSRLFYSGDYYDVEVHCGLRVFCLQRCMLAARSKFFETMLKSDIHNQSEQKGKIELNDMDPDILESVLMFIYTLKCPLLEDRTLDVMYCADRLLVDDLKCRCGAVMAKNFTVENICERLILADQLNVDRLFMRAVLFFAKNKQEIIENETWQRLRREHPSVHGRVVETAWDMCETYRLYPTKKRMRLSFPDYKNIVTQ